jgi:GNAT superfamily N-acetyltransferase
MNIRPATIWDAQYITEMWVKLMEETKLPFRNTSKEEQERYLLHLIVDIKNPYSVVLVVEDKKRLIGYISSISYRPDYGSSNLIGKCEAVYVEKEYRGKDIINHLIEQSINKFREIDVKDFEFQTVYDERLAKIWEKKGFKPYQITYVKEAK